MQILPKHAFLFLLCGFGNRRSKNSHLEGREEGVGGVVGSFGFGADRPGVTPSYFSHLLPTKFDIFVRATNVLEMQGRMQARSDKLFFLYTTQWQDDTVETSMPTPTPPSWQPAGVHNDTLYLFDCPPQLTAARSNTFRGGSKGRDGGSCINS